MAASNSASPSNSLSRSRCRRSRRAFLFMWTPRFGHGSIGQTRG
jgi:hypothetical protein